jgi:NAD-dependent dihydropyrimidine dehydrogenase PreA subunit
MSIVQTRPLIDLTRCDGKAVCVEICPYAVFEIRQISGAEAGPLGLRGWLRRALHGGRQAVAVRDMDCHACGLCVKECPEEAIRLVTKA